MLVILLNMMQCCHFYEVVFSLYNMKYDPWVNGAMMLYCTVQQIILILTSFMLYDSKAHS